MKKKLTPVVTFLVSAKVRPFEVWALRAVLAYFGVKLGIDASHI